MSDSALVKSHLNRNKNKRQNNGENHSRLSVDEINLQKSKYSFNSLVFEIYNNCNFSSIYNFIYDFLSFLTLDLSEDDKNNRRVYFIQRYRRHKEKIIELETTFPLLSNFLIWIIDVFKLVAINSIFVIVILSGIYIMLYYVPDDHSN